MDKEQVNYDGITTKLISDILKNIKVLNDITNTENDAKLKLMIELICNKILDKTNRRIFPPQLSYIVVDMVTDKYNSMKPEEEQQEVQSMSETGRTVTFGVKNKAQLDAYFTNKLQEYDKIIAKYRLVYKS